MQPQAPEIDNQLIVSASLVRKATERGIQIYTQVYRGRREKDSGSSHELGLTPAPALEPLQRFMHGWTFEGIYRYARAPSTMGPDPDKTTW
ncbi:hypothetical protein ON010_g15179 [Phytophthora cinnamomi]|nr:hypothetical protein ON010_g15179 [Phytophthora cinnamomi]